MHRHFRLPALAALFLSGAFFRLGRRTRRLKAAP